MMLLKQMVSAPAVQIALCICTAIPGCPRAREDNAEHVVVSYTDCLTLDAAPDELSVSSATLIVTVEPTLPGEGENIFVMSGHITVESNIIHRHWGRDGEGALPEILDKFNIFFRSRRHRPRVTLKGHHIWSNQDGQMLCLDGQTFGVPGLHEDGQTPLRVLMHAVVCVFQSLINPSSPQLASVYPFNSRAEVLQVCQKGKYL